MASSNTKEFQGKVALVTGSSSGIGKAIALTLARRGASVTLCGRNVTRLETSRQECVQASDGHDDRTLVVSGDVADSSHRQDLINKTVAKFGRLDILVCNAGGLSPQDGIALATEDSFDFYMNVMVKSVFFLMQAAVPHLEKSRGSVICVSSTGATLQMPGAVLYCTSKAALDHMCRCLALGLAPKGIRVNTVNPSYVHTRLHRHGTEKEKAEAHELFFASEVKSHLLENRLVTLEEIADGVAYLASSRASFITGQNLYIDGGRTSLGVCPETHPFVFP